MAQVQDNQMVPNGHHGSDRRRSGHVAKFRRGLIGLVRSRWIAMFVVAFSVSWAFNQVDNIGERKIEEAQRVTLCVIKGVADAQTRSDQTNSPKRIEVGPILQGCDKREGK